MLATRMTYYNFFQHFERLVEDRRYEDLKANFRTNTTSLTSSLPILILNHAVDIYTPAVYKMFEKEIGKAYDCCIYACDETEEKYKVSSHVVEYDSFEGIIKCSCKKFEFTRICAHTL